MMTPKHILEQQAEQGNVDAQLELAFLYRDGLICNRSYENAEYWTLKAAEQGDVTAIGCQYYYGYGVEKSYEKAVEWYTKAAEMGNARAQYCLGSLYHDGQIAMQSYLKSVDKSFNTYLKAEETSYKKAVEWFIKSAEQGYARAQYALGVCYEYGNGVEFSYVKAAEWYTKAAEKGYVWAQYDLAFYYKKRQRCGAIL